MFEAPQVELPEVRVSYQPILDVSRGAAAGYQAVTMPIENITAERLWHPSVQRHVAASTIRAALAAFRALPTNTFVSVPVRFDLVDDPLIQRIFHEHGDLSGIVLDVHDADDELTAPTEIVLADYRRKGALLAVGGSEDSQPELGSVIRLRPAIIRLGAAWTRDLDQYPSQRSAIELIGRIAGQLDAWILADDIQTAAELRSIAELEVPLATGPFIGTPHSTWPTIAPRTRTSLPPATVAPDGVLRALLQQAYTTRHLDAARSVLPDASGFEYVVVIDEDSRPVSLLTPGIIGRWDPIDVLTVNVDTPVTDTVTRALARPRNTRFSPIACTDAAGRFVGILRIERLMEYLASKLG